METQSGGFERRVLGRTGREVARLGIAASYGVPGAAVESAFERGLNYLYWGSRRTDAFSTALRNLRPQRERMVLVVQSYTRMAALMAGSLERALGRVNYDHADVLPLGMWNKPVNEKLGEQDKAKECYRRAAATTAHNPPAAYARPFARRKLG